MKKIQTDDTMMSFKICGLYTRTCFVLVLCCAVSYLYCCVLCCFVLVLFRTCVVSYLCCFVLVLFRLVMFRTCVVLLLSTPLPWPLLVGEVRSSGIVVHQPASPFIWPAVHSLWRGLSTNPEVTMWCVCGCS